MEVGASATGLVFTLLELLIGIDKSLAKLKSILNHLIDIKGLLLKLLPRQRNLWVVDNGGCQPW